MNIILSDILIKSDWTIPGQIKKVLEEAGEVAEAVALGDPVNTIREALDTMQTCCTLINMVVAEDNINLDRIVWEHNDKLVRKGYLAEISNQNRDKGTVTNDFDPVGAMEAAGIDNYFIDYTRQLVCLSDDGLSKWHEYIQDIDPGETELNSMD